MALVPKVYFTMLTIRKPSIPLGRDRLSHGTYIRWWLKKGCAGKEQSLLFDLFKAFDYIESSHKSDVFSPKIHIFLHACVTSSELPFNIFRIWIWMFRNVSITRIRIRNPVCNYSHEKIRDVISTRSLYIILTFPLIKMILGKYHRLPMPLCICDLKIQLEGDPCCWVSYY